MDNPIELRKKLASFGPTTNVWTNATTPWLSYSDGVKWFAENAGCGGHWLIDLIGTEMRTVAKLEPFLVVKLIVADGRGLLTATNGRTNAPQMKPRRVKFTDCPQGEWEFFLISGVLLLEGEY